MSRQMIYPDECYAIRGAVYEVYRELGSGFTERLGIIFFLLAGGTKKTQQDDIRLAKLIAAQI